MQAGVFIETENVQSLRQAVTGLQQAPAGGPRILLVVGPVGLGKTCAVDRLVVDRGAAFTSAARVWTPAAMLREVLDALGERPGWGAAECLKLAAASLRERMASPRNGHGLLIIDEADYLARGVRPPDTPRLLDTVRDLHDRSGAPIVLVGMDELARTLGMFRQFRDRVLSVVEFRPVSARETRNVARQAAGLELDEAAARELARATEGNLRRMINYLGRLERAAAANGSRANAEAVLAVEKRVAVEQQRMTRRAA